MRGRRGQAWDEWCWAWVVVIAVGLFLNQIWLHLPANVLLVASLLALALDGATNARRRREARAVPPEPLSALERENAMLREQAGLPRAGRLIQCAVCSSPTGTGWDGCCPACWTEWDHRKPEREVLELREELALAKGEILRLACDLNEARGSQGERTCFN